MSTNKKTTKAEVAPEQDLHTELLIKQTQLLESIDWKLWELYKALVKKEDDE